MNELVVLGLLSTLLSGTAGDVANATILAYSPSTTTIFVDNVSYELAANRTTPILVPVPIEAGRHARQVFVDTGTLSYALTVQTVGRRNFTWLWWAAGAFVVIGLGIATRIKQR